MARLEIEHRVAALGDLTRPELVTVWEQRYGHSPPAGVRQPLLVRAAAWQLQERVIGGLSVNAKRLLKAALKRVERSVERGGEDAEHARDVRDSREAEVDSARDGIIEDVSALSVSTSTGGDDRSAAYRSLPMPGARLIREWNGRRYVVDVVDNGFFMDDKPYRSLSAIALAITGTKWSGPRFFGL